MMKRAIGAALATAAFVVSTQAVSEPYVDYTPQKGYWQINAIEVDPNHVDDYLTGLRHSQVSGFEVLKRRGLIDDYKFMVRRGYVKGSPNVLIMIHAPTSATLDADKARDQAVRQEMYSVFSKEQGKTAVAGYEKYRTFIDDGQWTDMVMAR
jgi:hypothetical protein